jgi:hypothetical protein
MPGQRLAAVLRQHAVQGAYQLQRPCPESVPGFAVVYEVVTPGSEGIGFLPAGVEYLGVSESFNDLHPALPFNCN